MQQIRINRIHAFEWNELSWLPSWMRRLVTDFLRSVLTNYNIYQPIVPKLAELIQDHHYEQLMDFCSGSAGPMLNINQELQQQYQLNLSITLSDKYPNTKLISNINTTANDNIHYQTHSVNALDFPTPCGIRTFFTSFHHFKPQQAQQILAQAVSANDAIVIVEFTEKTWQRCLKDLLLPFLCWVYTPRIKPRRWHRWLFTYLIPIAPLLLLWDGMVSNFRTYNVTELQNLANSIDQQHYHWEAGQLTSGYKYFNLTYLIGYPK